MAVKTWLHRGGLFLGFAAAMEVFLIIAMYPEGAYRGWDSFKPENLAAALLPAVFVAMPYLVATACAVKWPSTGGVILAAIALLQAATMGAVCISSHLSGLHLPTSVLQMLLIVVPPLAAGAMLLAAGRKEPAS